MCLGLYSSFFYQKVLFSTHLTTCLLWTIQVVLGHVLFWEGACCTLQDFRTLQDFVSEGWPLTRSSRVVLSCALTFLMIIFMRRELARSPSDGAWQSFWVSSIFFPIAPTITIAFSPSCWLIVLYLLPACCGSSFVPVVLGLIECVDRCLLYRSRVRLIKLTGPWEPGVLLVARHSNPCSVQ